MSDDDDTPVAKFANVYRLSDDALAEYTGHRTRGGTTAEKPGETP